MPRVTYVKSHGRTSSAVYVGSKSIEWLARLKRAFRAC